ncbi:DinB family protein [Ruegeria pomeroyi]|uniref:DinB family protein n=1 Tax=Ruegeria pomeroyi TaxID=89184 RepID=A0A9Q3WLP8_9RHOB|nr:DinB family protein [Ruegeria pomeroyi]MCE8538416.1 DinB family protein [Ruegeria pomeroyi]
MITSDFCRVMASYNSWQNQSLISAADDLSHAARWLDQGAFFGSIGATLNHLYWADALILARLNGNERPQDTIRHSLTDPSDWSDYKTQRKARDREIEDWAETLTDGDLTGTVTWYQADGTTRIVMSKSLCAAQLFNHQTHHRGQVHAMLTAAGATPEATDLTAQI